MRTQGPKRNSGSTFEEDINKLYRPTEDEQQRGAYYEEEAEEEEE